MAQKKMANYPKNFHFHTGLSQDDEEENRPTTSRFVTYTDTELKELTIKKISKNTAASTKVGVSLLQKFCMGTGVDFNTETRSKEKLNMLLMKFYAGTRTEKGEQYKNNSMISFRNSLQRYFMETGHINIFEDETFNESNAIFFNILREGKKMGKGDTEHYPEIEPEDLEKLHTSFNPTTPTGLLEYIWFNVMFRLIRRGRENLRSMKKNTFAVGKDASGKRFIYQVQSESDKNHGVTDHSFETTGEGRIYETGGNNCPVEMFIAYLDRLHPDQDAFWQRPRESVRPADKIWFCNVPLGEKYLGGMMAMLSLKYNLSQRYTNHSIRVTSLQVLDDNCVESRHIIRISGHKSTESISNYARRLSAARKRNISSIFDNSLGGTCNNNTESSKRQDIGRSSSNHLPDLQEVPQNVSDDDLVSLPENLFSNPIYNINTLADGSKSNYSFLHGNPIFHPGNNLYGKPSQNMSTGNKYSPFKPIFNNCDNCSITFNFKN